MYVRATARRAKDGTAVRYLQLAHNEWDAAAGISRPKILFSFGREDALDRGAIERLVASLTRLLEPAAALTCPDGLAVTGSRPLGGTFILDALWRRLRIDAAIRGQLAGRELDPQVERVLFALAANRALAASSKLAAAEWITSDVHIDGLGEISDEACYRAMDWLLQIGPEVAEQVYFQVTNLLSLKADLLFFDTASTYLELDEPGEPAGRDERGHVAGGGDAMPQVVVGMAVTRGGIPVRVWSWPGNTADSDLIRQVRDDMRAWSPSRIVWVADRGLSSEENRRALMRGAGGYIVGEKLRSGSGEVRAALSRQGRYATLKDNTAKENLQVKEVKIGSDDRFVLCLNPAQARRDAAIRARLVAQLEEAIKDTDTLSKTDRARTEGALSAAGGIKRFLRVTPGGLLRVDRTKVTAEANLDGKYLLRCSDPQLPAEDIALGYQQLFEVERGWRDMRQILDLRPVYRRREDRVRAHILLCWLALLLIRVAESTSGWTWPQIRTEASRVHAVAFTGPDGTFRQVTELTKPQRDLFTALAIDPPNRVQDLTATL